jgi:hypothetical protein
LEEDNYSAHLARKSGKDYAVSTTATAFSREIQVHRTRIAEDELMIKKWRDALNSAALRGDKIDRADAQAFRDACERLEFLKDYVNLLERLQ